MFIKYSMFVTGSYCSQNIFTKIIHTDNFLMCTSKVSLSVANSDLEARSRGRKYDAFKLPFCLTLPLDQDFVLVIVCFSACVFTEFATILKVETAIIS
jgi:hypothetical protein